MGYPTHNRGHGGLTTSASKHKQAKSKLCRFKGAASGRKNFFVYSAESQQNILPACALAHTSSRTHAHTHSCLTSLVNHAAVGQLMELEGVIMRHKGPFFPCNHILSHSHSLSLTLFSCKSQCLSTVPAAYKNNKVLPQRRSVSLCVWVVKTENSR